MSRLPELTGLAARDQEVPGDVLWTWSYTDDGGPAAIRWCSHEVKKRTDRFVFVHRGPGYGTDQTVRLDRAKLDINGSAFGANRREYFTPEGKAREVERDKKERREATHQAALKALEAGRRQMELVDKLDFQEVAPGIWKAKAFDILAHDGREVACPDCEGRGKQGRRKCPGCRGSGRVQAVEAYVKAQGLKQDNAYYTPVPMRDFEDIRETVSLSPSMLRCLCVLWTENLS